MYNFFFWKFRVWNQITVFDTFIYNLHTFYTHSRTHTIYVILLVQEEINFVYHICTKSVPSFFELWSESFMKIGEPALRHVRPLDFVTLTFLPNFHRCRINMPFQSRRLQRSLLIQKSAKFRSLCYWTKNSLHPWTKIKYVLKYRNTI